MSHIQEYYNKIFSAENNVYGAGKPERLVVDILNYKNSGSMLELGAGQGRNSLFLAEKGFDVKAEDLSDVGIEKINRQAKDQGLNI